MGLGKFFRKTGEYLNKRWADNKELDNALKLEEARKIRETELTKLIKEAEKFRVEELKKIDKFKNLRKNIDKEWKTNLDNSVNNEMIYLNALKGVDDKTAIEHLSNIYRLSEDEATILYESLSKGKLKEYQNKVYKNPYYISRFKENTANYKEYKDYKDYIIPNNTTRNATEAVTPGAEAISTTANTTPEVPKDPSKVGALLNNILSGAGTGSKNLSKALLKGAYDNHALYGAYVGGAGGAGYTYNNNENPSYLDYLKNAALGAALGAGAFAAPSATLRALSKSGSSPTTGSIIRAGVKYGVVPTAVGMGGPIYDYTKDAFNPVVPEKPSQSNSLQMFTPEQTPANTNGGVPVGTNQQDTSEYNRKPKRFRSIAED